MIRHLGEALLQRQDNMAVAPKIIYKNHCTPQEKVSFSGGERWYLDSDCGRKLTGSCEPSFTVATTYYGTGTLGADGSATLEASRVVDFAFIKNTGDTNALTINITASGTDRFITLNPGDSFASEIDEEMSGSGAAVQLHSVSGTTYEYFLGDK